MQKLIYICAAALLLSGCTRNYKTVDEYETAMENVRNSHESYTIEMKQSLPIAEFYYKIYIKGDKWKTEVSMNGGKSFINSSLYNGKTLVDFADGSEYAVESPMFEALRNANLDKYKAAIDSNNPASPLFYWKDGAAIKASDKKDEPQFLSNFVRKNGFTCRMIKFDNDRTACINDKYGIAVYQKVDENIINVQKIDTSDIPDSTFELPKNVKIVSMDKMLEITKKQMSEHVNKLEKLRHVCR